MRRVYIAQSPPEAHLVRGYLESAGVRAIVHGEGVYTVRGGLPITAETAPSVWVPEADAAQAEALIASFLSHEPPPGERWRCYHCGEILDPQFTDCWQCGAARLEEV